MFKYTKRLLLDIQFWCREIKLRSKENEELDCIENDALAELRHPMAGFAYFTQKKHEREERIRLHKEEIAAIQ